MANSCHLEKNEKSLYLSNCVTNLSITFQQLPQKNLSDPLKQSDGLRYYRNSMMLKLTVRSKGITYRRRRSIDNIMTLNHGQSTSKFRPSCWMPTWHSFNKFGLISDNHHGHEHEEIGGHTTSQIAVRKPVISKWNRSIDERSIDDHRLIAANFRKILLKGPTHPLHPTPLHGRRIEKIVGRLKGSEGETRWNPHAGIEDRVLIGWIFAKAVISFWTIIRQNLD